jgi:ParB/Sulfiredoxin domain
VRDSDQGAVDPPPLGLGVVSQNPDDASTAPPLPAEWFAGPTTLFKHVDGFVLNPRNTRTHSPEQIRQLQTSMMEFGFTNPILEDAQGVVAGHGRIKAAKLLYDEYGVVLTLPDGTLIPLGCVPVLSCEGWSPEKRRAYAIADNQLALNAGWDEDLLRTELLDLDSLGIDASLMGFDSAENPFGKRSSVEYSGKIETPLYVPKLDAAPPLDALIKRTRCDALIDQIDAARDIIAPEVRDFLHMAAYRHIVFDYHAIAEFYCHASPAVQHLMEASALVIIDFDDAIEHGYVALSDALAGIYSDTEDGDEQEDSSDADAG